MNKALLTTTAAAALILSGSLATAQDLRENGANPARAPAAQQNAPAEKIAPNMNAGHKSQTTGQGSSESREMNAEPAEKSGAKAHGRKGEKTTGQAPSESQSKAKESEEMKSKPSRSHEGAADNERSRSGAASSEKSNERVKSSVTDHSTTTGQGAAGAHANLTTEQRTKITTVIRGRHVKPVEHVNFNISVGVRVPHTVHLYPLPTEVISIHPAWRGYEFILVGDQIIVIDPHTFEIVEVIAA